ncbi:hypothetical protein MRY87_06610 [bacterium]|nr:hypothetical protein [bacterium]
MARFHSSASVSSLLEGAEYRPAPGVDALDLKGCDELALRFALDGSFRDQVLADRDTLPQRAKLDEVLMRLSGSPKSGDPIPIESFREQAALLGAPVRPVEGVRLGRFDIRPPEEVSSVGFLPNPEKVAGGLLVHSADGSKGSGNLVSCTLDVDNSRLYKQGFLRGQIDIANVVDYTPNRENLISRLGEMGISEEDAQQFAWHFSMPEDDWVNFNTLRGGSVKIALQVSFCYCVQRLEHAVIVPDNYLGVYNNIDAEQEVVTPSVPASAIRDYKRLIWHAFVRDGESEEPDIAYPPYPTWTKSWEQMPNS